MLPIPIPNGDWVLELATFPHWQHSLLACSSLLARLRSRAIRTMLETWFRGGRSSSRRRRSCWRRAALRGGSAGRLVPPTSTNHQLPTTNHQPPTTNYQLTTNDHSLSTFQPFNFSTTNTYPLSIFPESERRRIAADFVLLQGGGQIGLLRVPVAVKRAITGAEKAMVRSRKRAEKGLCTKEESDAFCAKSEAALKSYLDKQVKEGVITPAERKAIGHAY